jgi:hypothetical protein
VFNNGELVVSIKCLLTMIPSNAMDGVPFLCCGMVVGKESTAVGTVRVTGNLTLVVAWQASQVGFCRLKILPDALPASLTNVS